MDCSLPGSSVHGILQARILEWVVMPCSRGSSTQGSNPYLFRLLHWQMGSLPLAPHGKPKRLNTVPHNGKHSISVSYYDCTCINVTVISQRPSCWEHLKNLVTKSENYIFQKGNYYDSTQTG